MIMKFGLICCVVIMFGLNESKLLDTSSDLLLRQKRSLLWKEGINWIQMIVGIGLPIEVKDQSITLGVVAKAFYLLPNNSTYYTQPSIDIERRKRSTRWTAYGLIETFLERNGYGDGKACLLRTICQTAAIPFAEKSGILAEIMHAILTPSSTAERFDDYSNTDYQAAENIGRRGESCSAIFHECQLNLMQQFSRILP